MQELITKITWEGCSKGASISFIFKKKDIFFKLRFYLLIISLVMNIDGVSCSALRECICRRSTSSCTICGGSVVVNG